MHYWRAKKLKVGEEVFIKETGETVKILKLKDISFEEELLIYVNSEKLGNVRLSHNEVFLNPKITL